MGEKGFEQTSAAVTPERERLRAGSRTLSLFGYSLNAAILRVHADEPLLSRELERAIGWAPQSSLRVASAKLCELGALRRVEASGCSHGTELTDAGRQLLTVIAALGRWLERAPGGPLSLDDSAARGVVKVLSAGWDSTAIRTLAERPVTLNQLSAAIPDCSYPVLKRRLGKLRATQLVTPVEGGGRVTPYAPSEWLHQAVAPLAAAAGWEQRHDPEAEPVSRLEVEAAFLLALPLVELPKRARGRCKLAVLLPGGRSEGARAASVTVEVEQGRIILRGTGSRVESQDWALGTVEGWLEAVLHGRLDSLRLGESDGRLANRLVKGLHGVLDIGET